MKHNVYQSETFILEVAINCHEVVITTNTNNFQRGKNLQDIEVFDWSCVVEIRITFESCQNCRFQQ